MTSDRGSISDSIPLVAQHHAQHGASYTTEDDDQEQRGTFADDASSVLPSLNPFTTGTHYALLLYYYYYYSPATSNAYPTPFPLKLPKLWREYEILPSLQTHPTPSARISA